MQSSRCFIQENYLITLPDTDIPISYVELAVISGGEFWSLGLRALYFATTLLLWFFGPIPMFATSVGMGFLLYSLDKNIKQLHNHRSYAKGKEITVRSSAVNNFYIGEGSNFFGVVTKMMTVNGSSKISVYNPATFYGIHVSSTPINPIYSHITVASGQPTTI